MRRLALAALLLLSACAVDGPPTNGPLPQPVDLHAGDVVVLKGSAVLAAPAGWTPAPTLITPTYPVPAPQLYAAMRGFLAAQPRTWQTVAYPDQNQAFFITRSDYLDFPDIVVVQAITVSPTSSQAVIYSHSRYDTMGFLIGENRERVQLLMDVLVRRFGAVLALPAAAKPVTGSASLPPKPAAAPAASPAAPAAGTPTH